MFYTFRNAGRQALNAYNEEVEDFDLRLVGHIPRKMGFYKLMDTNLELISHAEEILFNYLMDVDFAVEPDYGLIDTIVQVMSINDKWLSPTQVSFKSIMDQTQEVELLAMYEPAIQVIAEYWNWLPPENQIPSKFKTYGKRHRLEKGFLFQKMLTKRLNDKQVRIVAGTEAPAYWDLVPGKALHEELRLLRSTGISEFDVLKTATINPAEFLKLDNDYGTIEIGKIANI